MKYTQLIEQYAVGGRKLAESIRGLTREQFLSFPIPGTWSIQQIVMHMADSDLVVSDRMKRVIAEDNPTLLAYDEKKFAASLFYEDQPADQAVVLIDLNRKLFTNILRRLPETAFARTGTHTERGRLTLAQVLESAVNHLEHHLKFIKEKREKLGK
jgi:uncharacterized damage-inducible protein DinB